MQEREALLLMESNELTRLTVRRHTNTPGWVILIQTSSNPGEQALVTKRGKTNRIFKTSDAALRWCKKVGFNEVNVIL